MAKPETYPALYIIFTLLSAVRRGIERKNIWREFRRQGIILKPRLSFWVAVCREAGLVKTDDQLRVTSYSRQWLNKTSEEQAFDLIEAWQNAPRNRKVRTFRRKLLWKLKYDKVLTKKDRGSLHGLEALALINGEQLTKWGAFFIKNEGELPAPKRAAPCVIQGDHLVASLPYHADLLWDVEQYLRPITPGVYPLTKRTLQFHGGDPDLLIELIERGLEKPIPSQLKAAILKQPSIRITEGIVLEFSSPAELKQLRRQPVFRKYIDEFLSSQRVLVSTEKAAGLFELLKRRGVYTHRNEEQASVKTRRTHFSSESKSFVMPVGKSVPKLALIEQYKQLGQALDILYRAPGYPAEQRRITPHAS